MHTRCGVCGVSRWRRAPPHEEKKKTGGPAKKASEARESEGSHWLKDAPACAGPAPTHTPRLTLTAACRHTTALSCAPIDARTGRACIPTSPSSTTIPLFFFLTGQPSAPMRPFPASAAAGRRPATPTQPALRTRAAAGGPGPSNTGAGKAPTSPWSLPALRRGNRPPPPPRPGGSTAADDAAAAAGEALPSTWLFEPKYGLPLVRKVRA